MTNQYTPSADPGLFCLISQQEAAAVSGVSPSGALALTTGAFSVGAFSVAAISTGAFASSAFSVAEAPSGARSEPARTATVAIPTRAPARAEPLCVLLVIVVPS
ncbi:hypothetical protein JQN58_29150 [Aneurinibacillus sp. BA2021]|nr:hypothetical protein [Aneurinibacillus sp. BA2021]